MNRTAQRLLALRTLSRRSGRLPPRDAAPEARQGRALCDQADGQWQIVCLEASRGVLRLGGNDVFPFLQGQLTNDVNLLETKARSTMYGALLSPKGRYLHDVFMYCSKDSAALYMDVHRDSIPDIMKLLKRYRLRSAVDIDDVSSEAKVWVVFGKNLPNVDGWHSDPRMDALGLRFLQPSSWEHSASEPSKLAYLQWRMEHGVPEGDVEIPSGSALPLEYNLDGLNGVAFEKGCYVGQELTARTHFQGQIRKRVMPVKIADSQGVKAGDEVVGDDGKVVGQLRAVHDGLGLAHLRLQHALAAADGSKTLRVGPDGPRVTPSRPDWWPHEWGHEGQEARAA